MARFRPLPILALAVAGLVPALAPWPACTGNAAPFDPSLFRELAWWREEKQ
jgi:hypothetical protein